MLYLIYAKYKTKQIPNCTGGTNLNHAPAKYKVAAIHKMIWVVFSAPSSGHWDIRKCRKQKRFQNGFAWSPKP